MKGRFISGEDQENDSGVLLTMRDRVTFHKTASVSGKNPIKVETTQLKQLGLIESDSMVELKAHFIVNKGTISAERLDMKADWGVLNRGSLSGKRISITGSFVNLMGAMDAEESINIVGPISANFLGRISSAHYVSSSFVSLPLGLSVSNFKLNRGCLNQYTLYSMLQTMSLIFFGPSISLLSGVFSIIGLMSSTTIGVSSGAQVLMIYGASQAGVLKPHEWYPAIGAAAQLVKSAFLDLKILRNFWQSIVNPWRISDGDRAPKEGEKKEDDKDKKKEKDKNAKKENNKKKGKGKGKKKNKKEPDKPADHPYWDALLARAMGVSEYWVRKGRGWMLYASSVASNWNRFSAFAVVSPLFGVHSDNALLSMNAGLGLHSTEFDTLVLSTDFGAHFRVNGITEAVFLYNISTRYGIEESARAVWMVQAGQIRALDNAALLATYFWNKDGSARADNLRLEFGRMDNPEKIIQGKGEWAEYKARRTFIFSSWNDLNLTQEILRQCGLVLTGNSVDFKVKYKTEGVVQLNSTQGDVAIRSEVIGSHVGVNSAKDFLNEGDVAGNTFAFRAKGDVLNKGVLAATKFGYVEAGGDITNQCGKRVIQGPHSEETWYDPAVIMGGEGDGNGGPGLVMKARGMIISDASVIASKGDNILIADGGFDFKEEHNRYISKQYDVYSCFGANHDYKTTWATRVFKPEVISKKGQNVFISNGGGLSAKAATFDSAQGNYADVKGGISMLALKTKDSTSEGHGVTGLESKVEKNDEGLVWTEVHDDGFSRFCSRDGDVDLSGAYVWGEGGLALIAPNGQVIFDDEVLNHSRWQSGFNMGIGIPYFSQVSDFLNGSANLLSLDPTLDRLKRLAKSKKGLEWLVNGMSAGISSYNAASAIGRGLANDSLKAELLARYGLGGAQGFSPSARLSFGWAKSESHYQTKAGCGVNRGGNLYIQAGKGVVMRNGVQVHVDGNADIDAPSIMANGVDLLSENQSSQLSIGLDAALLTMSPTGAGVSYSRSSGTASNYCNAVLSAGGSMRLHYGKKAMKFVVLDGARLEANSFEGGIEYFYAKDHLSSYYQKSSRVGFDSQGNVNASNISSSGSCVAQAKASGIFSQEGFNTNGHPFHIHHADMKGGAIESQEEGHLDIATLVARPVPESHDSWSIGISFNVNNFELLGGKEPTGKPGEKAIATVDVSKSSRRYGANRLPFLGSASIGDLRGNVARTKEQILQVWLNQQTSYLMSVPLTNQAYLRESNRQISHVCRMISNIMDTSSNEQRNDLANSLAYWERQREALNDLFRYEPVESQGDGDQHFLRNGLIGAAIRFANGSFDWHFERILRAVGKAKFMQLYFKFRSMAPAAGSFDWHFERILRAVGKVKFMQLYFKFRSMAPTASFDMLLKTCKDGSNGMAEAGRGVLGDILGDKLTAQLVQQFYVEAADPVVGFIMAATGILDAFTYDPYRNQAWINSNRDILLSFGGDSASGSEALANTLRALYLMGLASCSEAVHTTNLFSKNLAEGVIVTAESFYLYESSVARKSGAELDLLGEVLGSKLGFFSSMAARPGRVAKRSNPPLAASRAKPDKAIGPPDFLCLEPAFNNCNIACRDDVECMQQCFEEHCYSN